MKHEIKGEGYVILGKGISTTVNTSAARKAFWLLPGETVSKEQAAGLSKYRKKVFKMRKTAVKSGALADVGTHYLVTRTIIFDNVSDATSFVLGSSRSGDVAKKGRKKLVGKNIEPCEVTRATRRS